MSKLQQFPIHEYMTRIKSNSIKINPTVDLLMLPTVPIKIYIIEDLSLHNYLLIWL